VTDRLLTTRQVSDKLGLSPEAVLRLWRRRELPGFRLSSRVLRFRESEIEEWLEGKREGPPARMATLSVVGSVIEGR
jgi:excisionase family DNA binding protein